MIENAVDAAADDFVKQWRGVSEASPILAWDETFPAVGVLDMMLSAWRNSDSEAPFFDQVVRGVSAALARYIHASITSQGRIVDATLGPGGIELSGKLDETAEGKQHLHLEAHLKELLSGAAQTLPVFLNFERVLMPNGNWLNPVTLGLLLGSSPLIDGCAQEISADNLGAANESMIRECARQSAQWYERVFPDETLGQVAELYLNKLIFPPMYLSEPLPALDAVTGFETFRNEYSVGEASLKRMLTNLAQSPDELTSASSLAFLLAHPNLEITPQLYAICRRHGAFLGAMRPALIRSRAYFGQPTDWITADSEYDPVLREHITREVRLGFLPWLKMPVKRLFEIPQNQQLAFVVQAISDYDLPRAKTACEKLCEDNPTDIDFRLQQIYLSFIEGDPQKAHDLGMQLLTEPEAESHPAVYNLIGMMQMLLKEPERALNSFNQARHFTAGDPHLGGEIANNYAWSLICRDSFQDALDVIDLNIGLSPDDLIPRMNRISCLLRLSRYEEAEREKSAVVGLCPLHPRVFFGLAHNTLLSWTEQNQKNKENLH